MPCSEKKRQANIKNAGRSTGPRSRPGKAKVALNAVTHGLYAVHLVLPGEDAAAFDALMATWIDDWQPPTDARRLLVEQAVAHAWRLRRCLKAERARLIEQAREAVVADAREADARVAAAAGRLSDNPASSLRTLLADRPGTEAVLAMWRELAEELAGGDWSDSSLHHGRLLNLLGRHADDDRDGDGPVAASRRLARLYDPDHDDEYRDDDEDEGREDEAPADPEALASELTAFLAEQAAEVEAHLGRLEPAEARAARLATAAGVLDDSPQGRAILRAEGHHGRAFRATLNQLVKLTQTGADLVGGDEPEAVEPPQYDDVKILTSKEPAPAPDDGAGSAPASPVGAGGGDVPEAAAPNKATGPAPPARDGAGDAVASDPARGLSPRLKQ